MSIIQQIFSDHFNDVIDSGISIRPAVFENVNKMIHCGNYKFGYTLFSCNHCGKFKMIPFSFKSSFCNSCGNMLHYITFGVYFLFFLSPINCITTKQKTKLNIKRPDGLSGLFDYISIFIPFFLSNLI